MNQVKVGPWMYTIEIRDLTDEELDLIDEERANVAGLCLRAGKRIVVVPDYKDYFDVLLHEIAHAINYEYPIHAVEDQEERADMIAAMIKQIISDNPELCLLLCDDKDGYRLAENLYVALRQVVTQLEVLIEEVKKFLDSREVKK